MRLASTTLHRRLVVKQRLLIHGLGRGIKTAIVAGVVFHWAAVLLWWVGTLFMSGKTFVLCRRDLYSGEARVLSAAGV